MNKRGRRMTMLKSSHYRRLRGERLVKRGPVLVLAGAVLVGLLVGLAPALGDRVTSSVATTVTAYGEALSGCTVTDGDTIKCDGERIRLLAIDAPYDRWLTAPVEDALGVACAYPSQLMAVG